MILLHCDKSTSSRIQTSAIRTNVLIDQGFNDNRPWEEHSKGENELRVAYAMAMFLSFEHVPSE